MENFYDIGTNDLKDIWDSDLDPSDTLKLSSDTDIHDWFLERDIKMPQVILHDKLMSDALLGNLPIKTEHSYSLNSDGDSMPDSPGSLQTKIEEMEDDCYSTIPINSTLTCNTKQFFDTSSSLLANKSTTQNNIPMLTMSTNTNSILQNNCSSKPILQSNGSKINSKNITNTKQNSTSLISTATTIVDTDSSSDIEIDDTCIKEEPLSPESSCPPSPSASRSYGINLNMANIAAFTNTDLVFEHKNGTHKLSPASHQSLLKNQQIILDCGNVQNITTTAITGAQRIILPKCNIKVETTPTASGNFGLPPTPPSSLPSDESEGNQSPEHHLISPMSPPNSIIQIPQQHNSSASATTTTTVSTRRNSSLYNTNTSISQNISTGRNGYSGSSTRQPIHTPLISSQPKGSTGTLVLTEEEKRTLLAEGYPIPTRLPLTKAEEKSLKKIRRKIKNKISAQESRRKKKEYMDQLERKVEILVAENSDFRKKVETLEESNTNLLSQLQKLQALVAKQNSRK